MKRLLLFFAICFFFLNPVILASDGTLVYYSNTGNLTNYPKIRIWNSSGNGSWSSEIELPTAGSPIRYPVIKYSPTSSKRVVVTVSNDGNLDGYACNSNCNSASSWIVSNNIGITPSSPINRPFDIEFETNTGNLLLVYSVSNTDGSKDLAYKILPADSLNFSGLTEYYINDNTSISDLQYQEVDLDRNPVASNKEIILVAQDGTTASYPINAWVWNGSAWGNQVRVSGAASFTLVFPRLAARYAADGSKGMVVAIYNAVEKVNYTFWNGSAWSSVGTIDLSASAGNGYVRAISLKADPSSDDLQLAMADSNGYLSTGYWNGENWTLTLDISTSFGGYRRFDFAWHPTGSSGILAFRGTDAGLMYYRTCNPNCNTTTSNYDTASSCAFGHCWLSLSTNPTAADLVDILGIHLDYFHDIYAFYFNNSNTNEYSPALTTESTYGYETFSFDFERFLTSLSASSSFIGDTTINKVAAESATFSGNCTCSAGTCNNVNIIIQDNRTGSFTDSTTNSSANVYVNITSYSIGTLTNAASANYYFNISANILGSYQFRVQCNSSDINSANSPVSTLTVVGKPAYSLNSTSSTTAGTAIEHRLKWVDDLNLSGFIFSWYNGANWSWSNQTNDLETGTVQYLGQTTSSSGTAVLLTDKTESSWGTGTTNSEDPYNTWYEDSRAQSVYLASELSSAGLPSGATFSAFSYKVYQQPGRDLCNFRVRLQHTSATTSTAWVTSGWTLAYGPTNISKTSLTAGNWYTHTFNVVNFTWDGSSNLLVDLSRDCAAYTSGGGMYKRDSTLTSRTYGGRSDSGFTWPFDSMPGTVLNLVPSLNITYSYGSTDTEANKSYTNYSDVFSGSLLETIKNITVTVYVSYYNNSGSTANGNNNPDLYLEIYNGSGWVNLGIINVTGTGNFSKATTHSDILSGWQTAANRDIRIKGIYFDYKGTTQYDQINYTNLWVKIDSEGEFLNDSWAAFPNLPTNESWSNVTKTVTSTVGATVKWRVYANDSDNQWTTSKIFSYNTTEAVTYGTLTVSLVTPTGTNNQVVNQTFSLQANVSCSGSGGATCGNVNGTLRYNSSSPNPDTTITGNNIYNTPFYTLEANPQSCGSLTADQNCQLNWTVNTTGSVGSSYLLAVNFTSDESNVSANQTETTTINIISAPLAVTLSDALKDVRFGSLSPGTNNNPALNNSDNAYYIACSYSGGNCNISIKGNSDFVSGANSFGLGNLSWNQVNSLSNKKILTTSYEVINSSLPDGQNQTIYFWIDIPSAQPVGNYKSNFTIQGLAN